MPTMSGRYDAQVGAQLLERAEGAVEDPRLDPEPAQLGGQRGDAERREEHLGRRSRAEVRKDERDLGHTVPLS